MEDSAHPPDALLRILDAVESLLAEVDDVVEPDRADELCVIRDTLQARLRESARAWTMVRP